MSIPKIIHYCWYGETPFPKRIQRCIDSWSALCPDYKLMRWDENNSPLDANEYVQQAFIAQKWAFVSDYVRIHALKAFGGIYLDTDVELLRPLDDLLSHQAFIGFESDSQIATCVIAGEAEHPLFAEEEQAYHDRIFTRDDGSYDTTTNVSILTEHLVAHGLICNGMQQNVNNIEIYPSDYFSPKSLETGKITITSNTYAIHHFVASWMTRSQRRNTKIAQLLGPKLTTFIKRCRSK